MDQDVTHPAGSICHPSIRLHTRWKSAALSRRTWKYVIRQRAHGRRKSAHAALRWIKRALSACKRDGLGSRSDRPHRGRLVSSAVIELRRARRGMARDRPSPLLRSAALPIARMGGGRVGLVGSSVSRVLAVQELFVKYLVGCKARALIARASWRICRQGEKTKSSDASAREMTLHRSH
jgi:hypothetical protein